jgi:hypothetical membrane protein
VSSLKGRRLWIFGYLAMVLAWAVIGTSWYLNRYWFRFLGNAFSDLGGSRAVHPEVYNLGLISTAILLIIYSAYLYLVAEHKMEVVGSAFAFIAGIFLAFIGIYHEGTRPHVFVSSWFFAQIDLSIVATGLGMIFRGLRLGKAVLGIGILAPIAYIAIAASIGWPSVASGEAFGIVAIDLAVVLEIEAYRRLSG